MRRHHRRKLLISIAAVFAVVFGLAVLLNPGGGISPRTPCGG
jgi:hypothetical protein